jgi:RHS repeat-associated protein
MKNVVSVNCRFLLITLFFFLLIICGFIIGNPSVMADDSIDTEAPSIPANLVCDFTSTTCVGLVWEPSTDNVGVTGYEVYNGQDITQTVTGTSFIVAGLQPVTSYSFTVKAKDATGNLSGASNEITVITDNEEDLEPPTVPLGLNAAGITDTDLVLTWEASSDNEAIDGYKVFRDGELIGTVEDNSFTDSGLEPNTEYSYSVKAYDVSSNVSEFSDEYKVSTDMIIRDDTTWQSQDNILIRHGLIIEQDAELTLGAGMAVRLCAGADVQVDGKITAKYEEYSEEVYSVFFTCERDPSFGGEGVRNSNDYWGTFTVGVTAEVNCEDINFYYSENALDVYGIFYSSYNCNIMHNASVAIQINQNAQFDCYFVNIFDTHTGIHNKGSFYSYMDIQSCADSGIETEAGSEIYGSVSISDCKNGMIIDGLADIYSTEVSDCDEAGVLVGENGSIDFYEGYIESCSKGIEIKGAADISNMEVSECEYGLYLDSFQTQYFYNITFLDNSSYAAFNNKATENPVDLKECYWNSAYGPTVFEKEKEIWVGDGDKVSEGIAYKPWIGLEYQKKAHNSQTQGIYSPTGNYSHSDTDLVIPSDFGGVTISRSYNSSDNHWGIFGPGWNSSYEGRIVEEWMVGFGPLLLRSTSQSSIFLSNTSQKSTSQKDTFQKSTSQRSASHETPKILVAYLPGGSSISYKINEDGTFTANDSRNKLIRMENGGYELTTKEQSKLIFASDGYLSSIIDKYGNETQIILGEYGKILKIIDPALREASFTYNSYGLVESITDVAGGRTVQYDYDRYKLYQVTDPLLNNKYYGYDNSGLLNSIMDHQQTSIESVEYFVDPSDNYNSKVHTTTDRFGNTFTYNYDDTNGKTTITDINGRQTVQWYDRTFNITESIDSENRKQSTEYYIESNGLNKYWESKTDIDRNGNKTEYIRDLSNGNVTGIINPDLSEKYFQYDNKNNKIMEKDETGRPVYYIFDNDGIRLLKTARPLDGETEYVDGSSKDEDFAISRNTYYTDIEMQSLGYKYNGLLKTHTDPEGNTTFYTYDLNGYTSTVTDAEEKVSSFINNSFGLVTRSTTPTNHKTDFFYDKNGNLEKRVEDNGATTRITYDFRGSKTKEVSPNLYTPALDDLTNHTYSGNHGMRYTYYSNGLQQTVTDAENNPTTYTYDVYGNIQTEHKTNGAINSYEYDIMNRLEKVYFSDGIGARVLLKEYEYLVLENGNTKTIETKHFNSNKTATTEYTYDYAGRLIRQDNQDKTVIVTEYYPNGLVRSVTDPSANTVFYNYDGLNRRFEERTPFDEADGTLYYSINKKGYDKNGNIKASSITGNKPGEEEYYNQTTYEYNARNLLVKATTYNEGVPENYTQYYYDADGNKVRMYTGLSQPLIISGLDNVTTQGDTNYSITKYEYDYEGKLIHMTDPLNNTVSYGYDSNGNNTRIDDRNGNITIMTYNKTDKMLTKAVTCTDMSKNTSLSYTYDSIGNIATTSSGGILVSYVYDKMGRLITETESTGITKEYNADLPGNRTVFKLRKNGTILTDLSYTYDNMGRLYQVKNNGIVEATYLYDQNGNRQTLTYNNGNSTIYTYSLNNLLKVLTNKQGNAAISQFSYTYFLDGNQAKKTDMAGNETSYLYDGLGRLLSEAVSPGAITSYTYDDYNNRATMEVYGATTPCSVSYQYDANSRLLTESRTENGTTEVTAFGYDFNDNQTSKGSNTYVYDGLNRLTGAVENGQSITYAYNANDLRSNKTVNGASTIHIWDGQDMSAEFDNYGTLTNRYIRGINLIFADGGSGTDKTHYLYNGHGDIIQLTAANGSVIKKYEYDAFGNEKNIDNNDTNVFRYCGEYFDKETSTYYLRARYYDPTIGRFITEDSYTGKDSDPLSLNLYTYCSNNPIAFFDPTGHWQSTDTQYSMAVQNLLLELTIKWYLSNNSDRTAISQQADIIRGRVSSGGGWWLDHAKQITEAGCDIFNGIAGSPESISKFQRDELLEVANIFQEINVSKSGSNLMQGTGFVLSLFTGVGEERMAIKGATSLIKESNTLVKAAQKAGSNEAVQKEINSLVKQFLSGNANPGIGSKHLINDIFYLRGREGGRIFYRLKDGVFEILGKSSKDNEQQVIDTVTKIFGQ